MRKYAKAFVVSLDMLFSLFCVQLANPCAAVVRLDSLRCWSFQSRKEKLLRRPECGSSAERTLLHHTY